MTAEKRHEFDLFYNQAFQSQQPFNFKEEFYNYYWSDVQLLSEGCLTFSRMSRMKSKLNDEDAGLCPQRTNLTLASA